MRGRARSARAGPARTPPRPASRARSRPRAAGRSACIAASAAESWPLPPSIDDEVRRRGERLVVLAPPCTSREAARTAARPPRPSRRSRPGPSSAADAELAVVRLLRRRASSKTTIEPTGDSALDVRDVEALDPERQALEVERLAQLLERLDAPQPLRARGWPSSDCEREPRVLRAASSCRRRFSPRSGGAHLDPRAALLGEERRRAPSVSPASARHDDLRRHARRGAVVLEAERLEHRRRRPGRPTFSRWKL